MDGGLQSILPIWHNRLSLSQLMTAVPPIVLAIQFSKLTDLQNFSGSRLEPKLYNQIYYQRSFVYLNYGIGIIKNIMTVMNGKTIPK